MSIVYNILVTVAVIIAIAFSLLVLVTGKGDAMSGGGSVRTTFKGKASFDDIMSKWTLWIGVAFMAVVLLVNVIVKKLDTAPVPLLGETPGVSQPSGGASANIPAPTATPAPATNVPAPTNTPVANTPATNAGTTLPSNGPTSSTNAPLDSTPATVPSANAPAPGTEPSVVPTVPGTNAGGTTSGGTTGGATNAAPPAGNR